MADPDDSKRGVIEYCRGVRAEFLKHLPELEKEKDPETPLSEMFQNWRMRWLTKKLVYMATTAEELEFYNLLYGNDDDRSRDMWDYAPLDDMTRNVDEAPSTEVSATAAD